MLSQEPSGWWQATCLDARGHRLHLAALPRPGAPQPAPGQDASLRVSDGTGVVVVSGVLGELRALAINGISHEVLELAVDPASVRRLNRRSCYRVAVALKGEIAVYGAEELRRAGAAQPRARLEALAGLVAARRRPCVTRDLSAGGAMIATGSPAPALGRNALLDLTLAPGEVVRNLTAVVVECHPGTLPGALDARVRLRFEGLSAAAEAQVSRAVMQAQRVWLKQGLRG